MQPSAFKNIFVYFTSISNEHLKLQKRPINIVGYKYTRILTVVVAHITN